MESVVASLLHYAESRPDALAVIDYGRRVTYGALGKSVRATAVLLHQAGVRAGDTAAMSFDLLPENSLRSLQFFYALAYLGAAVLPLAPETPAARRVEIVKRFNARWLVSRGGEGPIPDVARIDPVRFDRNDDTPSGADAPRGDRPERPFLHLFTSGTTGTPKVCLFTAREFSENRASAAMAIGSTAADRQMSAVPWPATMGLRTLLRIQAAGGTFVNARFPETRLELASLIGEFGITQLVVSPWQIRRILKSNAPPRPGMPELRTLLLTGAFIFPHEIRAIRETITPNVYNVYGSNELGLMAVLRPEDPVDATGGVGKAVPGMEVQAVGEDHRPTLPGTVGHLRFRAPWMPKGYLDNETATLQRFRDGWFYPGDIGSIDAAGYITLRGRSDEVINFGAIKILPGDIEAVLVQHPDVSDAALVGIPDPMAGQLAVAFVVLRRDVSQEDLRMFCAERIDANRIPSRFVAVREIARNADGKIRRDQMRDEFLPMSRPTA